MSKKVNKGINYSVNHPCEVLPAVLDIIRMNYKEYILQINGIDVYRGRKNPSNLNAEEFASPKKQDAKSNRMSPEEISYFYCSENRETAINEIDPKNKLNKKYISEWYVKIVQRLVTFIPFLNNFGHDEISPSQKSKMPWERFNFGIFNMYNYQYYNYSFLVDFANKLMEKSDRYYKVTQSVTACLRANMPDIDGLEYQSVQNNGVNYCLFLNHAQSLNGQVLDFRRIYEWKNGIIKKIL